MTDLFLSQTRSTALISTWNLSIREVRDLDLLSPRMRPIQGLVDVVWPETKQIGIIDSVFRNFYIPPVIFGV